MFNYFKRGRKTKALAFIAGAVLMLATGAAAAWIIYSTTITGNGGSTNAASSTVGAFTITAGTPSLQGSPGNPASIAFHIVNNDPNAAHTFRVGTAATVVTLGAPVITGGTGGCTEALLTNTPHPAINSNVSDALSGKSVPAGGTLDVDVTIGGSGAYTVASTAPISCASTTLSWPITGTLAA